MKKIKILTIVSAIGLLCQTCKVASGLITKNWKKEVMNQKTDFYNLRVHRNRSTGCPQSKQVSGNDSLIFINTYLATIIKTLVDKTESRIIFGNMTVQKALRLDIHFTTTHQNNLKTNRDSLLAILAKKMNFSVSSDSVLKKVYAVTITDSSKLNRHLTERIGSVVRTSNKEIDLQGISLLSLFQWLENDNKIVIDYSSEDTRQYKLKVPRNNTGELISYLRNDCGINLRGEDRKVAITKVTFETSPKR